MTVTFQEFYDGWNEIALSSTAEEKGPKFERYFLENVIIPIIPKGYRTVRHCKIRGIDYNFDFLIVKPKAIEYRGIGPEDVLIAFEVKSHGFFSQANIETVKYAFETTQKAYPHIKLFYVTFRETNYYDNKARIIFGKDPKWYYRLSDSGDGIQIPPKSYFPNEWVRLEKDLGVLKSE